MRGIDLKIDDIWGLDLSMTGRVSDSVTRRFFVNLAHKIQAWLGEDACRQHYHKIIFTK